MNTIYIIFISIIVTSFILGLLVTFFKTQNDLKLHKYNNEALQKDNYEYAKDYIYNTREFNFSDKINIEEEPKVNVKIDDKITENTIIIPILSEYEEENQTNKKEVYAIMDEEII